MKINVSQYNRESGDLECEGTFNEVEIKFLLQYAINTLMSKGVLFDLSTDSEELRLKVPEGTTFQ